MLRSSSGVLGPSVGLQFPVLSGGWKTSLSSSVFEVMDPVFFLLLLVAPSLEAPQRVPARFCGCLLSLQPSGWRLRSSAVAAGSREGIDGRLSSPPSGVADGAVSCTLDALCIDRFSGQSWPILDFPLCEFSAGLCRFLLPSPLGACRSPLWLCTGCFSSLWFCLVVRI